MSYEREPKICREGWCGNALYISSENGEDWCEGDPKMCALFKANRIRLGKEWPPRDWREVANYEYSV